MNAATSSPAPWLHEQAGQTESVEVLTRRAMNLVTDNALRFSPSKVSRLVRSHIRNSGSMQVAARMLEAYFLNYADPTGETAVRNVMAGAR